MGGKGTPRASSESRVTLCLWDSYYVVGKGLTKLDLGVVSKTTLIGCVTLSKSLNFSGHQFPHAYDRDNVMCLSIARNDMNQ